MGEGESSRSGGDESESEEERRYIIEEGKGDKMSGEYEKKRLTRIAENRARLEALGISKAAKALLPPSLRKPNSGEEDDDDYRPGDEIDESEYEEDEEEFLGHSSSKRMKTTSPPQKRRRRKKHLCRSDPLGDDDDLDLNKAIALSLAGGGSHRNDQGSASSKKNKSDLIMSKMQMTADELILYFFHFDKAGKGFITLRDLATMANVHDFTWSDEELQDMIRCFDFDKDGKLSLDEFRKVVTRCRMLNES
ncbi:calmodulin-like protein 12 isoform X2 [Brassica napus]|uniref:calmodulin-like protein 12 isoform X2 n=1 Tax=Brassica napus TaxID=3708 RepID=UPI002078D75E|nr:calmodulin-like protein 12 isoform X2 [Brassica napus]